MDSLCEIVRDSYFNVEELEQILEVVEILRPKYNPSYTRGNTPFIHTASGKEWHHSHPLPADTCIEDVASSMSKLCRFTGHVKTFYSVAEHSVRVSYLLPEEHQLWGLLHDCGESVCADMARPLKYSKGMWVYRHYEKLSQAAMLKHFGLSPVEPKEVKLADDRLLVTEQRDLMRKWSAGNVQKHRLLDVVPLPEVIVPWSPEEAQRTFIARFYELTGQRFFYRAPEERNRRESFRLSDIARTVDQVTATGSPKEDRRKPKEN